ncbi:hypothetical protein NIES4071_07450 [Calothrix sp. NIES-4071]|nr:hypothetical protein NIES4071_07450 [Calothrix sp. NIES-4071]BAZ55087.1 hypothetical protein NIES4105_07410 [Calothrix sp. NIES-4105]
MWKWLSVGYKHKKNQQASLQEQNITSEETSTDNQSTEGAYTRGGRYGTQSCYRNWTAGGRYIPKYF